MTKLPLLKVMRERKALTQAELAERTGLDRTHLSKLETGVYGAHPKTVRKLARVLKVQPVELMAVIDVREVQAHGTR
jgi:transcriptional regulator with XRE-family HTH domain